MIHRPQGPGPIVSCNHASVGRNWTPVATLKKMTRLIGTCSPKLNTPTVAHISIRLGTEGVALCFGHAALGCSLSHCAHPPWGAFARSLVTHFPKHSKLLRCAFVAGCFVMAHLWFWFVLDNPGEEVMSKYEFAAWWSEHKTTSLRCSGLIWPQSW